MPRPTSATPRCDQMVLSFDEVTVYFFRRSAARAPIRRAARDDLNPDFERVVNASLQSGGNYISTSSKVFPKVSSHPRVTAIIPVVRMARNGMPGKVVRRRRATPGGLASAERPG